MLTTSQQKIALILMAAGSSSRLGRPKQLVQIKNKQQPLSLLCRQISLMNNVCASIHGKSFCVLGYQSSLLRSHLADYPPAKTVSIIENNNWYQGLSSSIAYGVSKLEDDIDAVLILLVDQWQLTAADILNLIGLWQQQPENIHIASKGINLSPPVIFPRQFFKELMTFPQGNEDEGAKNVIKNNKSYVKSTDMPLAFIDLDTPEQLAALIKQYKSP